MASLSFIWLYAITTIIAQENDLNSNLLDLDSLPRTSYIVMMKNPPLLHQFENVRNNPTETQEYHQQLKISHIESMTEAGVDPIVDCSNHYFNSINGYSALMTPEQSQIIAKQINVESVIKDSIQTIETDASPQFLELTFYPNGAYSNNINGEGVVIGVLDTGIWPEHPSFMDDGTYGPPPTKIPTLIPCNFGNTDYNYDDLPFECNNKIIGARRCLNTYDMIVKQYNLSFPDLYKSARDDDSHGTHVASTAAGNSNIQAFTNHPLSEIDLGKISGIAHRAHIIAYKVFGYGGGVTSDIAACIDYATMDKVDVLNYSGGGGIHTFISSAYSRAFFEAVKNGIFAVNSAGNSGRVVPLGTITSPGGDPWLCTVAASTQPRLLGAKIKVEEKFQRKKLTISNGIGIIPTCSVSLTKSPYVPFINGGSCDKLSVDEAEGKIILCKNDIFPSFPMMDEVRAVNGLGVIFWTHENSTVNGNIFYRAPDDILFATVWFEEGQEIANYISESFDPNNVLIKVTNKKIIFKPAPSIPDFSSRGPNRAAFDIIKPDITAPGVEILAGMSPNNYNSEIFYRPGDLFRMLRGTSMSAPHISGIAALIKQFHVDWGPDYIKSAIMTTAYQSGIVDTDLITEADTFDYGSGHVNPGTDFRTCRYPTAQSIINPGLVYPTSEDDYNSALCEGTTGFTPESQVCDDLSDRGYTNLMRDLNQPNIGAMPFRDVVTVRRYVLSVASGTNRFEVEVNKPNGIEVKVSPRVLKLRQHERGDYTVTFSATSNTIFNDFYFGDLIWKSGIYSVYSAVVVYPLSS